MLVCSSCNCDYRKQSAIRNTISKITYSRNPACSKMYHSIKIRKNVILIYVGISTIVVSLTIYIILSFLSTQVEDLNIHNSEILLQKYEDTYGLRMSPKGKENEELVAELQKSLCYNELTTVRLPDKHFCPNGNIVTVGESGRLANIIWEYAAVWGVARKYNLTPYIPICIHQQLSDIFENLKIPPLSFLTNCVLKDESTSEYPRNSLDQWISNKQTKSIILPSVDVDFYYEISKLVLNWLDEIRAELKFKKTLNERAQNILREKTRHLSKVCPVVYVGVHVRRGDYEVFLPRFKVSMAGPEYFFRAMDYFRTKYNNVAFLVVSDDLQWCQENLITKNQDDVFIAEKEESAAQDLAIMAACNHSIFDYGTYGEWGAMLANGETIMYNITHGILVHVTELLPKWQIMS